MIRPWRGRTACGGRPELEGLASHKHKTHTAITQKRNCDMTIHIYIYIYIHIYMYTCIEREREGWYGDRSMALRSFLGMGDDTVGNPHRAQIS